MHSFLTTTNLYPTEKKAEEFTAEDYLTFLVKSLDERASSLTQKIQSKSELQDIVYLNGMVLTDYLKALEKNLKERRDNKESGIHGSKGEEYMGLTTFWKAHSGHSLKSLTHSISQMASNDERIEKIAREVDFSPIKEVFRQFSEHVGRIENDLDEKKDMSPSVYKERKRIIKGIKEMISNILGPYPFIK